MDDDSKLLGLVLGATLSVSLGLFTVALCHYLGVARLMLALSSTEPSSYTWMYPAYTYAVIGRISDSCWLHEACLPVYDRRTGLVWPSNAHRWPCLGFSRLGMAVIPRLVLVRGIDRVDSG